MVGPAGFKCGAQMKKRWGRLCCCWQAGRRRGRRKVIQGVWGVAVWLLLSEKKEKISKKGGVSLAAAFSREEEKFSFLGFSLPFKITK